MTKAFARATSQEHQVYYSEDWVIMNDKKTILAGRCAEDAWSTEIKADAQDLSGRLGLVIGMPVIIVDNIAVELNVSNGSRGTLVGITYYTVNGRRFAVTADIKLPNYINPDPSAQNRNVVTLSTKTVGLRFVRSDTGKTEKA
ncbi:hypothetical protein K435DRAFT_677829 [Dendrothele bispora CBS 962.96]|uniref:Uncharacterized protein n=1 Tax=Dendrothele bispora (strain CBS 962.96) TaxID=1314807 RepID=A0A4S8LJX6_DENBC|nr:hypothetical protein K435DRAFT_677829 [Dendrothele bispora CBS 962.96]